MLSIPAEFPNAGAPAFLRATADAPQAQPVRIIQRNADGTALVAVQERFRKASSTRTVRLADLAATAEAAQLPPARRRAGRR